MEYIHTVLAQVPASLAEEISRPGNLLTALDQHRGYLEQQPGFQDLRVSRSINREGQVQLVIETRWVDENSLVRYETQEPNIVSILDSYSNVLVPNTVQVLDMEALRSEPRGLTPSEIRERLALPLIMPLGILAFALLFIYGLSRVYLDVPTDVATPLAAGIAGGIFVVAWFIAANPRVGTPQIAGIVVAAAALLLGGSLFAAIHDEGGEKAAAEGAEGPAAEEPAVPGSIAVALSEWKVEPASQSAPADTVSFSVTNKGATVHNFKVIKTDLAPDRLPIRQAQADESQLEVVASIPEFVAGQTREVSAQLAAGKYVLICNVGGHYQLGMRAGFTVQ